MIDRRSFLLSSAATSLGLLLPGQRAVASPTVPAHSGRSAWDYLGTPRSWSLVRQGLHPIAPERVVVLTRPRLSRRLHHLVTRRDEYPFAQLLRDYDASHSLIGRRVTVFGGGTDGAVVAGRVEGLDGTGRLLLRDRGTLHRVIAGQVRVD